MSELGLTVERVGVPCGRRLWAPGSVARGLAAASMVVSAAGASAGWWSWWAVAVAAGAWGVGEAAFALSTWRHRRLFVGAVRRWLEWEFWPSWLIYVPIAFYMLWLGLRHRGLLLFTASNPAMPAGGLVGESKFEILQGLSAAGTEHVARATLLDPAEGIEVSLAAVRRFLSANGLDYPLAVKPDEGCRGQGVAIVRSEAELGDYLRQATDATIVQEFAPGQEFGVFYYRRPGEATGHILSVTEKRAATVVGDGTRTLEELILADRRAVCLAHRYLSDNAHRLDWVPPAGEQVKLGEIGAHARGCVFLDGNWVMTPELAAAIDELSRAYDGFYSGRYDIITPSVDDFRLGRNFKVIELNGVSSEATEIYDPAHGLFAKYRLFFRQWRLAYEIGAANVARGARAWTLRELARLILTHVQRNRHPALS